MTTNSDNLTTAIAALYTQLAAYDSATDLERTERITRIIKQLEDLQASGAVAGDDAGPIENEIHGIV